jgi:NCAIR mutase (PurE)-related protein
MKHIKNILIQIEKGKLTANEAIVRLDRFEEDLGFARVDIDRLRRRKLSEVIYCPGKTNEQLAKIMLALKKRGQNIFATRASLEQYEYVKKVIPEAVYHSVPQVITADFKPLPAKKGLVVIVSAGTSDIPVAEEAALSAERMGAVVKKVYDVGVAGLHRMFKHLALFKKARAIVVVAGMEGALPSVIGGLIDKPVIAVPTSIGYGTGFHGITPLLAMLNSCVPGVVVVNIDNGFGAGVAAGMINRLGEK